MRVNLMIEGQEGVTWEQWVALAEATERAGLEGMLRSDHYQSVASRPELGTLDAWGVICALAALTERIRLGTLVSPASFRHPSVLAKSAVTADHVSGGRVELGMGAGWSEPEHRTYGLPFHDVATRYDVFEEQVEIVARQLTEEAFDFEGQHYTLRDCQARPKPVAERGLPLIVGGAAKSRSARIAARWADEYNTIFATAEDAAERRSVIDRASEEAGRDLLTLSVMTMAIVGRDEREVRDRAALLMERAGRAGDVDEWLDGRRDRCVIGTVEQAAQRLAAYERAGVSRMMLQNLLHDDTDMVSLLGLLG